MSDELPAKRCIERFANIVDPENTNTYGVLVPGENVSDGIPVEEPKQGRLFADYRYFFYLTNDRDRSPAEIVRSANDCCQQENLIALLAAVRALHAPVDNLRSNEAYVLMTALAWNLKAWLGLWPQTRRGATTRSVERKRTRSCGWSFARL